MCLHNELSLHSDYVAFITQSCGRWALGLVHQGASTSRAPSGFLRLMLAYTDLPELTRVRGFDKERFALLSRAVHVAASTSFAVALSRTFAP